MNTTDSVYFRFSTYGQIVDIWSKDGRIFNGFVVNYTYKYKSDDEQPGKNKGRLFFKRLVLDSSIARRVYYMSKNIENIPTEDSIPEWNWSSVYALYTFETSSPLYYCKKEYKSPNEAEVPQAKIIQNVIDSFNSLLRLRKTFDDFTNNLPFGCCYAVSPNLWLKKLNKRQSIQAKKNRRYLKYLDSISTTVNQYLSDTLTTLLSKKNTIEYSHTFYAKFSKNNKLIKVTGKKELYDKDERRDYRRCRKMIIKAFRQINLDFVHTQIPYEKELYLTAPGNATVYSR
jgi:hypothetical protein